MKTIHHFALLLTAVVGLASSGCSNAQYGSQQPGYGSQPGYGDPQAGYGNQPGYSNQPGYPNQQNYDNQPGYDNPDFYSSLAPYGQWVQTPQYGTVWIPNAESGFQPYASNGHWVVTEYGNTWVSDYPWGWAPFHYGRWYYDNYRGWAWVPGTDWGPAWVSWRSGNGYYGWAPLGPGMNVGTNVNIAIAPNFWTFVPQIYITSPQLYSYYVPRPRVITLYQNTTYINTIYRANNRSYYYGPARNDIERITRRSVPVYRIERQDRPGRYDIQNGAVRIYQPDMARNNGRGNSNRPGADNRPNGGYNQPSRPDNTPSSGGRGAYTAPFDNRPPATGTGQPTTGNDRRNNNPTGSGRGTYSTPFDNSPAATPNPGADRPGRTYPEPNNSNRGGVMPGQPNRGFDDSRSRGSFTPTPAPAGQPSQPVDDTPRSAPSMGRPGQGNGFDGGQPQRAPESRGNGNFQQPRAPEQPQQAPQNQGRGSYQPQGRPQEAASQPAPGARQDATPPSGGDRPGGGRGSRGPR